MRLLLLLLLTTLTGSGCLKDILPHPAGHIEFRLLEDVTHDPNAPYVVFTDYKMEKRAFIAEEDIAAYEDDTFTFTLQGQDVIDRVAALDVPTPFALLVEGVVIYTGYFRQSYLSSSCDCLRIDPQRVAWDGKGEMPVELGYASIADLGDIDQRNDERLLAALRRAGKLR